MYIIINIYSRPTCRLSCKKIRTIKADTYKETLQDGLSKLVKWPMLFNVGKFKCIHIGYGNVNKDYVMGDTILGTTNKC